MAIKNWSEAEAEAIQRNLNHPVRIAIITAIQGVAVQTRYNKGLTFWDATMADAVWDAIRHHFEQSDETDELAVAAE